MEELANFDKIVLAWVISLLAVEIIYYFMSKGSEFDRLFGKFRIWTAFYVILIFLSYFYISTSTRSSIVPSLERPMEVVMQQLAKSQQEMKIELRTFREVLSFLLFVSGFYMAATGHVLQTWRNEHRKLLPPPVKPRPLGLDPGIVADGK